MRLNLLSFIATSTSIGRLFIAGLLPGLMLTCLFMAWSLYYASRHGYRFSLTGPGFTWRQRLEILPKILPFLAIIALILWALYGGLITPPVGLNLYVINSVVPDVKLTTVLWGALPFMLCMVIGIILLILLPSIATWLPNALMGITL